jgi:hypothetical protein
VLKKIVPYCIAAYCRAGKSVQGGHRNTVGFLSEKTNACGAEKTQTYQAYGKHN